MKRICAASIFVALLTGIAALAVWIGGPLGTLVFVTAVVCSPDLLDPADALCSWARARFRRRQ